MSSDRPSDLSIAHLGDSGEMANVVECLAEAARISVWVSEKKNYTLSEEQSLRGAVILALLMHDNYDFIEQLKYSNPHDVANDILEHCNWEILDA